MTTTLKLKPGVLVSCRTSLAGGVHYSRKDLEKSREDVTDIARWETVRVIDDVVEHDAAKKARADAGNLVRRACIESVFGLLCPSDEIEALEVAIAKARSIVSAHNDRPEASTRITLNLLKATIAATDEEAASAIAAEVRELLTQMETGIRTLNVDAVRKAASEAKALGSMLADDQSEKLGEAVSSARKAAREIVKRIDADGDGIAQEIAREHSAPIVAARVTFMEFDVAETDGETMPAVDGQRFAEIDLEAGRRDSDEDLAAAGVNPSDDREIDLD